jgi:hypothetical protein
MTSRKLCAAVIAIVALGQPAFAADAPKVPAQSSGTVAVAPKPAYESAARRPVRLAVKAPRTFVIIHGVQY